MLRKLALVAAGVVAFAAPAIAEWQPAGPIKMVIAFRAGGGADTQGRLLAEELEARKGWKIIPENITGKGGSNMANAVKGMANDGSVIGMVVTETFTYTAVANPKAGYEVGDFTYVTTTAPTQMGLVVKSDSGMKTMDDVVAMAKKKGSLTVATMSPRLEDGAYYVAGHFGFKINTVSVKGGKGALNAIVAGDVDIGWIAGIHAKGVKAGDLVNVAAGEAGRLMMSPDTPTMMELGVPFDFGAKFVVVGPAGMPADARAAIAKAIGEVVNDPSSKTHQFIAKAFGPPLVVSGGDLDAMIASQVEDNKKMLKALQ
jgi:tripartite-type tricarboxylate transporter receptor subunit TctC